MKITGGEEAANQRERAVAESEETAERKIDDGAVKPAENHSKKPKMISGWKRMLQFLLFGVFLSFVPLLLSVVFYWFVGYEYAESEHMVRYLVDLILAIFAVATNACGCVFAWRIPEDSCKGILKGLFIFLSIMSMGACTTFYAYFFNIPPVFRYDRLNIAFWVAGIVGAINAVIGLSIPWMDK